MDALIDLLKSLSLQLIELAKRLKRKLFTMKKGYKIYCGNPETQSIIIETPLKRKKLPYYLSEIVLVGTDKSQILSCQIQSGETVRTFDENDLSKNKRQLKTNCLIKHYGKSAITLTLEISRAIGKCTIGLIFKENKNDWGRDLQYIYLPTFDDLEQSI